MSTPYSTFAALHRTDSALVLVNVWDAGSAIAAAEAGAPALATGSWAVAAAHGSTDGQHLPFDLVLANVRRITQAVDVPVSVDIEQGYGDNPASVAATVAALKDAGAVGINIEDALTDTTLRDAGDHAARLAAVRAEVGDELWINARTDVFLQTDPGDHQRGLDEAVQRARRYAEAGASSLFAPGLADPALIGELAERSALPVNVMAADLAAVEAVRRLGVARISMGPGPYRMAMRLVADLVVATRQG